MAARPLALRVQRAYICPSCHNHRQLSSTARQAAISPESPRYIDIPEPPQQTSTPRQRRKGILPSPRDVMKHRTPDSVEASILSPLQPRRPSGPRERFAASMTALRKANLASGAEAVYRRREAATALRTKASGNKRAARTAAFSATEHPVERLTAPTLDASVAAELARYARKESLPDPERDVRLKAARRGLAEREERDRQRRMDGLHSLYMNARHFIVDEQGLNKAIDEAFGTVDEPREFQGDKPSMWGSGEPPKLAELGAGPAVDRSRKSILQMERLKARVTRMAEAVTGGKMDP